MPTYEYRCHGCHHRSTRFFRSFSQVTAISCPYCKGNDMTRLPSTFSIHKPWDFGSTLPSYESMSDFDEDDPSSMAEWAEGMRQDMGDEFGGELDDLIGSSED